MHLGPYHVELSLQLLVGKVKKGESHPELLAPDFKGETGKQSLIRELEKVKDCGPRCDEEEDPGTAELGD